MLHVFVQIYFNTCACSGQAVTQVLAQVFSVDPSAA